METCSPEGATAQTGIARKFSFGFYFQALAGILSSPRRFFSGLPHGDAMGPALGCLLASSLFFACAGLTLPHERPFITAAVLCLNAVFMCFISAAVGYAVMTMTLGRRVGFSGFFSVYAYSASVTLLAAWIPLLVWITEPWKWLLIGMGLVRACGLRWFQAAMIVGISIFVMVVFFWSLGPVILYLKE